MTLYIGADHGGYSLKQQLLEWLKASGYDIEDCGAYEHNSIDDYPEFAFNVAQLVAVAEPDAALGILLCRSSEGMTIAANKVPDIRAVAADTPARARLSRAHNNANILSLAADELTLEQAQAVVTAFVETAFSSDERHVRRLNQISGYEQGLDLVESMEVVG